MSHCYCINPNCTQPENNPSQLFCQACGSKLLLQGEYRVRKKLGGGGFGVTYEVESDGDRWVLKVLTLNDEDALRLFKQEAMVLAKLNHPGIPKVAPDGYFQFQPGGGAEILNCLVMEYIEGENLKDWLQRWGKPISQKLALQWLMELTRILLEVHQKQFLHRDIKPANVMLREGGQLALIDFGTVREITATYLANKQAGQAGTMVYSRGYAPTEQENGHAVPQSDFFAVGRTFVYLLTGRHPLDFYDLHTDTIQWRSAVPDLSPLLGDFLDQLMSRLPKDRPANPSVMLKQLIEIQNTLYPAPSLFGNQGLPSPSQHSVLPGTVAVSPEEALTKKSLAIAITSSIVLGLLTGIILLLQSRPLLKVTGGLFIGGAIAAGIKNQKLIQTQLLGHQADPYAAMNAQPKNQPLVKSFRSPAGIISSVVFHPNGQQVACSNDNTIRLISFPEGQELQTFKGHTNEVYGLAFSPDGQRLASCSWDKTIKLWQVSDGTEITTFKGHKHYATAIAFHPKGDILASGSWDKTIKIWSISQNRELCTFTEHDNNIETLAFSPDGRWLASGSWDKTIKLWDWENGLVQRSFIGHTGYIKAIAFHPNGQQLASGSWDKTTKVWDIASGKVLLNLKGHSDYVRAIAFNATGDCLATASHDHTIRIWDSHHGNSLHILRGHEDWVTTIAAHPEHNWLISGSRDKTLKIWTF